MHWSPTTYRSCSSSTSDESQILLTPSSSRSALSVSGSKRSWDCNTAIDGMPAILPLDRQSIDPSTGEESFNISIDDGPINALIDGCSEESLDPLVGDQFDKALTDVKLHAAGSSVMQTTILFTIIVCTISALVTYQDHTHASRGLQYLFILAVSMVQTFFLMA